MRLLMKVTFAAVVLGAGGWGECSSLSAAGSGRPAERIIAELEAVAIPSYDVAKKDDQAYVRQIQTKLREAVEKRAALILELYEAAPEHERIPEFMAERWSIHPYSLPADRLVKEIDQVIAHTQNSKLKIEGAYARTYARLYNTGPREQVDLSGVETYLKLAPKDPRGSTLLDLAARRARDSTTKITLENRILDEFPDSPSAQTLIGIRQRLDRIGRPFELEFNDAITGAAVSIQKLRGKVIVIDFWATWCAPCVAEMPRMKALYSRFHDRAVEFIGVSLDRPAGEGGLDRLKTYVADNEIDWPQYYQGNGWDSAFSRSCGITTIPTMFIIDAEGKLYSDDARGKLESILEELLEKRKSSGH